ncbi:MAG TPA: pseudouridine synthase [Solimonas sp.]|nr:pseudouridine synthase [Solimonas sp.]
MTGERIQKALATAGVASRREIERMIEEGRITVNGQPATPGQRVEAKDRIRVDERSVQLQLEPERIRVLLYKKQVGELVTRDDPDGRKTVFRKLPKLDSGRWIAVGRLDINTSGLLLFTNNGELARRLTHPSFEVPRTYAVRVLGTVDDAVISRWKSGVVLEDGMARFERVEQGENEDGEGANQWYIVSVREGRNRLVRRLIESQDLQVSRLIRLSYGPLELGRGNKSGTAREATPQELAAVLAAVGMEEPERPQRPRRERRAEPSRTPDRHRRPDKRERQAIAERAERQGRGERPGRADKPARSDRSGRGDARSPASARPARARPAPTRNAPRDAGRGGKPARPR